MLHESSRYDGDLVRFRFDNWEAEKGVFKSFWFGIFCLCCSGTAVISFEGSFVEIVKNSKFDTALCVTKRYSNSSEQNNF
jgi:hypothetical protein